MSADRIPDAIRNAAAEWHSRLNGDGASEQLRAEFAEWLAKSPSHQNAYAVIKQTWNSLRSIANQPEILELRQETELHLSRSSFRLARPVRWVAAAATVLLAVGLLMQVQVQSLGNRSVLGWIASSSKNRVYTTNRGERLSFMLVDGSHITLDAQSELRVDYSKRERLVHLIRGQAMFEVAKDRVHPFVVMAGTRRFVAVGTAFNVRLGSGEVKITMVEGTVRVEPLQSAEINVRISKHTHETSNAKGTNSIDAAAVKQDITTITQGDQLVVDAQEVDHLTSVDATEVTTWLRGELVFDNASLADAVSEINRYAATQIELADPKIESLRLSGSFNVSRPELFVEAVTNYFPITATPGRGNTVLLTPR